MRISCSKGNPVTEPSRVAVALACLIMGACCAGEKALSERLSTLWGVNGPRLRRYADADPALRADPSTKAGLLGKADEMDHGVRSGSPATAAVLWKGLGPRLRAYLMADSTLDADSRRIRLESVDRMDDAAREAKGGAP